jgi:hypothetical protein
LFNGIVYRLGFEPFELLWPFNVGKLFLKSQPVPLIFEFVFELVFGKLGDEFGLMIGFSVKHFKPFLILEYPA